MIKRIKKIIAYYYQDMKLQKKFIISHLILALAPTLVVSALLYNQLSEVVLSNSIHTEQNLSRQTARKIEETIEKVNKVSNTVIGSNFFLNLIQLDKDNLHTEITGNENFLASASQFLYSSYSLIDGAVVSDIKIYLTPSFEELYTDPSLSSYPMFRPMGEIKGSYWHGIFTSTNSRMLVCPSLYLSPSEVKNYGEFSIVRKLTSKGDPNSTVAYVAVYFTKANLDSILKQNISFSDSATYVINERDAMVSSSNTNLSGKYLLSYEKIKKLVPDTTKFETTTFALEKTYVCYKEVMGADWYMVSVLPVNNILYQNRTILWQFILIYLIFLCVTYFLSLQLSGSIVKRISSVIHQMKLVKVDKPKRLAMKLSYDEIGDLVDTYNYMCDEINSLMEKEAKAANDLRISEFKALQAQINPHFLYNTLDMINWLSKSGKSSQVSEAVQALSRFYKLTLGKGNITVSIREELYHVSLYVKLQNMRYRDKIHFIIDVPDELLDYEIPKLVLQPIVENSIQHGIFGKESKEGTIVIMGWMEDDNIVFIVSDDGIGIPSSKIDQILTGQGENSAGTNIGIYNTHKRLRLFYDKECGLSYRSTPGVETEVEIRIPARKLEGDHSS